MQSSAIFSFLILLPFLVTGSPSDTPSPKDDGVFCYVTVSNGAEHCYYSPPGGYTCDALGNSSNPSALNYTECSLKGVCYMPIAGNQEVCYYLQPYGYQCYFERIEKIIANMTQCESLKANTPPQIQDSGTGPQHTTQEDTQLHLVYISIDDDDARDSEAEGDGYIEVTLSATNGYVGYNPDVLTDPDKTNAIRVLDQTQAQADRATFTVGNGSLAENLQFTIRAGPLQDLMKCMVFLPEEDFVGGASILIDVDDRGNTGGTPESASQTVIFTVTAVNDPPTVIVPDQSSVPEDSTSYYLSGIVIDDVDVDETPPPNNLLTCVITTVSGTIHIAPGSIPTCILLPGDCEKTEPKKINVTGTLTDLNTRIFGANKINYQPDQHFFGADTLTVDCTDRGHTPTPWHYTPRSSTITVSPINDAPEITTLAALEVDEDTWLNNVNVTIADVDDTSGLSVMVNVTYGSLTASHPYVMGGVGARGLVLDNADVNTIAGFFGALSYLPDPDFNGVDYLVITVDDVVANGQVSGQSSTKSVPINVAAVNDPPMLVFSCPNLCPGGSFIGNLSAAKDTPFTFSSPGTDNPATGFGVPYIQVVDVDAAPDKISLILGVEHGLLSIPHTPDMDFTVPAVYTGPTPTIVVLGTLPDINAALAGLTYEKKEDDEDELQVVAIDLGHNGKGETGTDFASVYVYPV